MSIIAIDFDGTIVTHEFPAIGDVNPEAFSWMKRFQEAGARLILWTMRSDGQNCGPVLTDAVEHCRKNGVEFFGVNSNPEQIVWTASPKAYAQLYIDDAAFGCPLRENPKCGGRPMVDWSIIGPAVMKMLAPANEAAPVDFQPQLSRKFKVFTSTQRDRIRAALEARAASAPVRSRGQLRRAAREGRVFDRLVERKAVALRKENPGAGDGEILKMILDWISNGGLETILKFIGGILALFV